MPRCTVLPRIGSRRQDKGLASPSFLRSRGLTAAVALVLLLSSIACTDLSAVAKFAASAKGASAGFAEIAADFAGSARRRSFYVSEQEKPKALEQAQHKEELEPQMVAAQKILVAYITGLAGLAADSTTARDQALQATSSGLVQLGMSSDQAGAGIGLVSNLTNLFVKGYRSREIEKSVRQANAPLQLYLEGLEQIVSDYQRQLNLERESMRGFYDRAKLFHGQAEPVAMALLDMKMDADLQAIKDREAAATAYKKIPVDIGAGHQTLYDHAGDTDTKRLAALLEPYAADMATQSITLAHSF